MREKALNEPVLLILLSLAVKPDHGYALIREVLAIAPMQRQISSGTMYGALGRLLDMKWIERCNRSDQPRHKRTYRLTQLGRKSLNRELDRMSKIIQIAAARLGRK